MTRAVRCSQCAKCTCSMVFKVSFESNPDWDEYLKLQPADLRDRLTQLRSFVRTANLIGVMASPLVNDTCFVFADGAGLSFTVGGWGDFMQSVVGLREGPDKYYGIDIDYGQYKDVRPLFEDRRAREGAWLDVASDDSAGGADDAVDDPRSGLLSCVPADAAQMDGDGEKEIECL